MTNNFFSGLVYSQRILPGFFTEEGAALGGLLFQHAATVAVDEIGREVGNAVIIALEIARDCVGCGLLSKDRRFLDPRNERSTEGQTARHHRKKPYFTGSNDNTFDGYCRACIPRTSVG